MLRTEGGRTMKFSWREYQIFLFGFYTMATFITLMLIYFEVGTLNKRILLIVLLIFAFGYIAWMGKFIKSKEKAHG